jgi:hypothetical protein
MAVRARPDGEFPVLVCQKALRDGASLVLGGRTLAPPAGFGGGVVALGDTGCRVKGSAVQDCASPAAWPFPQVAREAAEAGPGLVVHVGDYHYREECADTSVCNYGWGAWEADFFRPGAPLLEAAPWVFARGNHESCDRAGVGWFRFLDAGDQVPLDSVVADTIVGCQWFAPPFAVDVPELGRVLTFDSSCAPFYATCASDSLTVALYAGMMRDVQRLMEGAERAWFLTHSPPWYRDAPTIVDSTGVVRMQAALDSIGGAFPAGVRLVIAGHVHQWEALSFGAARPSSLIVGNGGTLESTGLPTMNPGEMVDGLPLAGYWATLDFGYSLLRRTADGLSLEMRAVDGTVGATCRITDAAGAVCTVR